MKKKIKTWYPNLWTLEMVKNAVEKGAITKEEYKEITEKEYE
jgi:hypothetical protein